MSFESVLTEQLWSTSPHCSKGAPESGKEPVGSEPFELGPKCVRPKLGRAEEPLLEERRVDGRLFHWDETVE